VQIAPIFVPLAAVGLALVMVGAAVVHSRRHEPMNIGVHAVLIVLTAFVAWGRIRLRRTEILNRSIRHWSPLTRGRPIDQWCGVCTKTGA